MLSTAFNGSLATVWEALGPGVEAYQQLGGALASPSCLLHSLPRLLSRLSLPALSRGSLSVFQPEQLGARLRPAPAHPRRVCKLHPLSLSLSAHHLKGAREGLLTTDITMDDPTRLCSASGQGEERSKA